MKIAYGQKIKVVCKLISSHKENKTEVCHIATKMLPLRILRTTHAQLNWT